MRKYLLILIIAAIGYGDVLPAAAQAPGNALEFAGTPAAQNALFVPNGGSHPLDITGSITIETWIKPARKTTSDEANKWNTIMMKGSYGYGLVVGDDNCQSTAVGKLGYWGQNSCGSVPFSTIPVEYGKWNHVAVVISNGNLTFYINGEPAGTAAGVSIPTGGAGTSLYVGVQDRMSGGNGWYKGAMDELRIWNTARTANEIKTNMYHEVASTTPGLAAYFRFDQGTAGGNNTGITVADDLSANNLDAALSNFTLTGATSNFVESYAMVVPKAAAASNVSSTGFTANWETPEVGAVTSYLLDVAADKNFSTIISGYNGLDVGTGTSYAVTGLSGYHAYYYRLRSDKTSVSGTGARSASTLVTVPVAGLGTAISFERNRNEGIQVPHHASFNFGTGSYTIESWVKRSSGSGFFTIVGKQSGSADGMFLRFNDNVISFAAGQYPASTDITSASSVSDGNWHHLAAVRNASDKTMKIYIDGILDKSQTFGTLYSANTAAPLGIGFKPNYGEYFEGSLDEVRIWNIARTSTQIKEYMSVPLSGSESGLVAYWNFEEGTGTSVDDLSSNSNTGSLQNSDGDEWSGGNIGYQRAMDEDGIFTFRLGGSDLASQSAPTAVVSQLPSNGKIYQTSDGTTKEAEITSTGVLLADAAGNPRRLIYEPSANYNGTDLFKYQVKNGAVNSANTETVNITINPVNDPPVITSNGGGASAGINIAENTTAVTTVTATDADAGTTITYSIAGGADQLKFSINSTTGVLAFISPPDFEIPADADVTNTYLVTVRAGDGVAGTDQTVTVTVTDDDDTAPAVPAGLSATPGNAQITLNWTPNAEGDLNGYKVYGGTSSNPSTLIQTITAPATTYTVSGLTNGTAYYYRISSVDNTGNESALSTDVSAVPKAGQIITFNAVPAKTYGDHSFTISATASSGLTVNYSSSDPAVASVSGNTVTIIKAGSTVITASQAGNDSFNAATDVSQTLQVNTKAVTVSAGAKTKTYGDADPALTYTFSPVLVGGDSFSGSLSRAAGENAGTYAIGQGTLALSGNYTLSFQLSMLNITAKPVIVTANSVTKMQGIELNDVRGSTAFGVVGLVGSETIGSVDISYGPGASAGAAAGTYAGSVIPANAAGGTFTPANYAVNYVPGNLLVTPLPPSLAISGSLTSFITCAGNSSSPQSITARGNNLTGNIIVTASAGFEISLSPAGGYMNSLALTASAGTVSNTAVYIRISSAAAGTLSGSLTLASNDVNPEIIPLSGIAGTVAIPVISADGPLSLCSGGSVMLSSSASEGNQWYKDGMIIAGETSPAYRATSAGDYTVKVTNSHACSASSAVTVVTVNPLPDAKISSPADNICSGESVTLTASGGGSYQWYLDGNAIAGATADAYQATVSGSYTVRATNATGCFSLSAAKVITVSPVPGIITAPIPDVTTSDNSFVIPYLTATGNADQYSLDGISAMSGFAAVTNVPLPDSLIRVSIPASAAGTYTFSLTVRNSTTGCSSAPVTVTLKINLATQIIAFNSITKKTYGDGDIDPGATTDSGLPVSYTSSNPAVAGVVSGKLRILSAGSALITAIQPGNAVYAAASPVSRLLMVDKKMLTARADNKARLQGTANPQLTITYNGFIKGEDETVLISPPVATTTATISSPGGTYPITVSGGTAANYSFTYVSGELSIAPAAPASMSLAAEILYENQPSGTKAGILGSVSDDPAAVFTYSLVQGAGDTDNNLFTISGNELRTSAALNYEHRSVYSILVRAATQNGLSLDKQFNIIVHDINEAPTLDAVTIAPFCFTNSERTQTLTGISPGPETGQKVNLSVSSTDPDLLDRLEVSDVSGGNAVLTYRFRSEGTASVTVTITDNGDTFNNGVNAFSRTFTITANALPLVSISSDIGTVVSKGDVALLTASGGTAYQWDNAPGITAGQSNAVLTIRPEQTTTYRVSVTNASGCSVFQDITINVKEDYKLDANNIMSPDGDGVNDRLAIKNADMYPNNMVRIYDRAGRLLYEKKNYSNEWDGTFRGSPLVEDTYFYVVDFGPGRAPLKGFVSIIRKR